MSLRNPFATRLEEEVSEIAVIHAHCLVTIVWNVVAINCLVRYVPFYHVAIPHVNLDTLSLGASESTKFSNENPKFIYH